MILKDIWNQGRIITARDLIQGLSYTSSLDVAPMARWMGNVIYIDRDPSDPYKGWGWVEATRADCEKFSIPEGYPLSYENRYQSGDGSERFKYPNLGNLPSRGNAGTKKFILNIDGELVEIRAQKLLTNQAVFAWVKSWASPTVKIVTPGKRTHSIEGDKLAHQAYFVYFILNEDSNAIKIGLAKDTAKRLKALQTSSPAKLKLIKTMQVDGLKAAQELEQSLHKQFHEIRLSGEWFRAESQLLEYLSQT